MPVLEPAQLHIIGVHFFHDFFALAKGFINPTTKGITPALNRSGQIGTENGINGTGQSLKYTKNRVRQIKEQAGHGSNGVSEYVSDEVCHGGNQIVDQHEHVNGDIPQGHEQVPNEGQRRHKCAANNPVAETLVPANLLTAATAA